MTRFDTPGIYVKEKNAFGNSVVPVPTAIPAFIGYTEKAERGKESLLNQATRITTFADYVKLFGNGPRTTFKVNVKDKVNFEIDADKKTKYNLYNSMRLFYANGGSDCYIISVGDYSKGVKAKELNDPSKHAGLSALLNVQEPTMVVIPDALLLDSDSECYNIYQAMLTHCGLETQSRFSILDVYNGDQERTFNNNDVVEKFRSGVGNNYLSYGAAYYPHLNTSVVNSSEVDHRNISNTGELVKLLSNEANATYYPDGGGSVIPKSGGRKKSGKGSTKTASDNAGGEAVVKVATLTAIDTRNKRVEKKHAAVIAEIEKLNDTSLDPAVVHQNLLALSPVYKELMNQVRTKLNVLPASGAIAGIYSSVDSTTGVHKAPANVSVATAISPTVYVNNNLQEDLNLPISGKAVNAIRSFTGKGTLVWGARTLAGNSQDWRYINVRRTMIMLQQSIKQSTEAYVFEPNTERTWLQVKTSIENFLSSVWQSGALVGSTPSQAYNVSVGLGSTMSPVDVLDGIMRISILVAISRPAEFIEITFEQKMLEVTGG